MYRIILSIMMCLMFIAMPVMAQQEAVAADGKVTIDLSKLNETNRNAASAVLKLIAEEKKAAEVTANAAAQVKEVVPQVEKIIEKIDPDKFQKYVDTIVMGVTKLCKGLGVAVNEFIHTDVGILLTGLIVYNCGGKEMVSSLWSIVGGIGFWVAGMAIMFFFFRHFFGRKKLHTIEYDKDGKKVKSTPSLVKTYDFTSGDARSGVGACIGVAAVLITIVCLILVF